MTLRAIPVQPDTLPLSVVAESFDTRTQMTPDVPTIDGLVSGLGDLGMSDRSHDDISVSISDRAFSLLTIIPPSSTAIRLPLGDSDIGNADVAPADPSGLSYRTGNVELVRSRVTNDGRTKLKVSLLSVAMVKCAICIMQFKASALDTPCQHAFHKKCLESWLDRSQTCPLCTERLVVG